MESRILDVASFIFDAEIENKSIDNCVPMKVGSWDSLAFLNFILALEEEFSISFDPDEIAEMSEGGRILLEIIEKKVS